MYFTSHHVVFSDGIDGEEDETGVKDKKIADTNTGTNWVLLPSSRFTLVSVHHGIYCLILSIVSSKHVTNLVFLVIGISDSVIVQNWVREQTHVKQNG